MLLINRNYDAVVVGSGPNGLAAAITLAQAGLSTVLMEAAETLGGGARSAELTLPGFVHDICSAVHPMAVASPFLRSLPLDQHGLEWIQPEIPLAHPVDGWRSAAVHRSVEETAGGLGGDSRAYTRLFASMTEHWEKLLDDILHPMIRVPRHPWVVARFGLRALHSAQWLAGRYFKGDPARALFAGLAMHSAQPLEAPASAAIGLALGLAAHAVGWPMPKGGAGQITQAMAAHFRSLGGHVETGVKVDNLRELPSSRVVILDVTPRQLLRIATGQWPERYAQRLEQFQYGPGIFKVDYALNAPIPWSSAECRKAGTVHVGGTYEQIAQAARQIARGEHPERPFVLVAQPTLCDPSRAPAGKHIAWAYCHVPNRSTFDMSDRLEKQIERFAPGFRDCIIARHILKTADLERHNANLVGGSIDGGAQSLRQTLARPILSPTPYRTPMRGVYLCSSSTPPGGGVHGMCGHNAAVAAIKDLHG